MPDPFKLFDAKGRARYCVLGDYRSWLQFTAFKTGLVNKADRLVLYMQYFLPFKQKHTDAVIAKVGDAIKSPIKSLLLFDTSWYKDTSWVGFMRDTHKKYFVKVFKRSEELIYQIYQTRFVQEHFSGPFVTVPVVMSNESILVQDFIERKRDIESKDHIEDKIIHLSEILRQKSTLKKRPEDIIPLDLAAVFNSDPYKTLSKDIKEWATQQAVFIEMIPVHGDMTPWNMYVSHEEKHILIDYERAGWHVPFYDYFHYILQPLALKNSTAALPKEKLEIDYKYKDQVLALYLIDQLYHDIGDHLQKGFDHKHLQNLIRNKTAWLRKMLHAG